MGPRGSPRLKRALASFFNSDFRAHEPVLEKEVLVLPGVAAVIDAVTWSVCNDGDGIITPAPFYTGFKPAVGERARGVIIPALFRSIEGYQGLDDIFDPEMNTKALSHALAESTKDGIKVKAVMLCKYAIPSQAISCLSPRSDIHVFSPHNPLGRCYVRGILCFPCIPLTNFKPAKTLKEVARFCGRNRLHLIVDEVFAKSVYDSPHAPDLEPFTSILALDLSNCISRQLVHVAYGMGKDFGAAGLRLGALHSRNESLIAAVSSIWQEEYIPILNE